MTFARRAFRSASVLPALAALASAQGYPPTFQRNDLLVGQSPLAVEIGDLNGDGADDLVAVSSGLVRVLLADGQGDFAAPLNASTGALSFEALALGDIDGDGELDVVGVDRPAEIVAVMLGDGGGGLGAAIETPVGIALAPFEIGLALGDFDQNGRADVVASAASQHGAVVLLSSGAGALAPSPSGLLFGAFQPSDVAVGRVDADGFDDVVLCGGQGVAVYLGLGAAMFAPPVVQTFGGGGFKVSVGDVDLDGLDDVFTTRRNMAQLVAFRSLGGGSLAAPVFHALPALGTEIVVADLSRDGQPDVAVGAILAGSVQTFLGDGAGALSASTAVALNGPVYRLAAGDVDFDGAPELAAAYSNAGLGVSALSNTTPASHGGARLCSSKVNSLGCTPTISASGVSSASATSGFVVSASNVLNHRAGILLYGVNGPAATPYLGGVICARAPLRRTPVQNSGGAAPPANDCSGALSLDMNAFAQGLASGAPAPELSVAGVEVVGQYWSRDGASNFNASLSDGWIYGVGP